MGVLQEAEAGVPIGELCRRLGVSDVTFYRWKAKYGGLEVNEARRLRQWEEKEGWVQRVPMEAKAAASSGSTELFTTMPRNRVKERLGQSSQRG